MGEVGVIVLEKRKLRKFQAKDMTHRSANQMVYRVKLFGCRVPYQNFWMAEVDDDGSSLPKLGDNRGELVGVFDPFDVLVFLRDLEVAGPRV